jgi:hypothetical protein
MEVEKLSTLFVIARGRAKRVAPWNFRWIAAPRGAGLAMTNWRERVGDAALLLDPNYSLMAKSLRRANDLTVCHCEGGSPTAAIHLKCLAGLPRRPRGLLVMTNWRERVGDAALLLDPNYSLMATSLRVSHDRP